MHPRKEPGKEPALNFRTLWQLTDKQHPESSYYGKSEKCKQIINQSADEALNNAKEAAFVSLPIITAAGVQMMCDKSRGGDYSFSLAPLGLPVAIGGIVIDTVKAPFCLAVATEEAVRGGITKLVSLMFEKGATEQAIERIFKSFLLRMRETATILVALGLEPADVLDNKLKSGEIEELVGLTLLHTAYASRHVYNSLCLAAGKKLSREDCPPEGLALFDAVLDLKVTIEEALKETIRNNKTLPSFLSDDDRNKEESRIVCQWIRDIKTGVPLNATDRPDATQNQLGVVNTIIAQIDTLRQVAITMLPEEPAKIARKIGR